MHDNPVDYVNFSPNGKFIASGGGLGKYAIKIWSADSKELLYAFNS